MKCDMLNLSIAELTNLIVVLIILYLFIQYLIEAWRDR